MIHRYVLHNHSIRLAADPILSPGQLGLLAGWGVFSTLKVTDGVLFAFERHWARMAKDAALMHIPFPEDPEELRQDLLKLVQANGAQNATLRVVVVRNGGGLWEGPSTGRAFDVLALTADTKNWGFGVKLAYQGGARHSGCAFSGAKITSWAMNLTWVETANRRGFDEVILLNERGEISECTSANIFAAFGENVLTPALSSGCLPGVTREVLLHEIHVPGFKVVEATLFPADLENADQVFITSTTRDLLPVVQIEDCSVRHRGSAREELQQAFSHYIDEYVKEHKQAGATA